MNRRLQTVLHLWVAIILIFPWPATGSNQTAGMTDPDGFVDSTGSFRARLSFHTPSQRTRLDQLGVKVLSDGSDWALVLVSADQLETLARLRFTPQTADELGALVAAYAEAKPWLAESLRPALSQAANAWGRLQEAEKQGLKPTGEAADPEAAAALGELERVLGSFTPEQTAAVEALTSVDDDGDGLTNTQEAWWCTDPNNPNSDGDANGYTDGQEVAALLDFTLPRAVRWGYGPPFGPPAAWPAWNQPGGCNDGDFDTIPDYAEVYMVGSRVPEESTDLDKFDDGQELFGVTYCPGAPTSCGYGSYPRIEYWNYIQASMPGWVEPPGDNLFVAAFPVPEVSVVPGSWHVERVTTITTQQGQMVENQHTYETSATRGQSSSIADTVNWNNWEEVSQAVETPMIQGAHPLGFWERAWGAAQLVGGIGLIVGGETLCIGAGTLVGGPVGTALAFGSCGVAVAAFGGAIAGEGWSDLTSPDEVQNTNQFNRYDVDTTNNVYNSYEENSSLYLNQNIDTQGMINSLDGIQFAINHQAELLSRGLYDISYQISRPRFTETRSSGQSWGGAQTTTHEEYEEHTITDGQAFTTGENWSTAWAVDSSHAANLTFNFTVSNTGSEYAREIKSVIINIYLGDDANPIISYPAWEKFPDGTIQNIFPGDVNNFASDPIPLSLEQMKRIDLGERLTVVLEDYSYGADELFYQNAASGGLTVFIEDGVEDGDELVDSYVIPTWGTETIQDVLTRHFPHGVDLDGNLNALWTPEFDGANPPTWEEHYLSDISWWNIYLSDPDAGNTPLHQLPAQAGSAILFRFNRDSDRDGYQDRVELRYLTDKDDPASHPQPRIFAGYVEQQVGDTVTVTLKLGNSGNFDAYGIDAVMYAPDNSVTIGNNTVGGNGRVRAGQQVAVGSLVKAPDLANWTTSTARPYATGNYTGGDDKSFIFSVTTPGAIGSGSTAMSWDDGLGGSGSLALGSGYHAPLPVSIAEGLEVGFDSGSILAGQSFSVQALTPRDTFTYTINTQPYTEPVIVVSYSDPQGSHRFITPVQLTSLEDDLAPYIDQMLPGVGLQIATDAPVDPANPNPTHFLINSPHAAPLEDAHLYLNFVSDGQLVAEMPYTMTLLEAGPTVFSVDWSTSSFSQPYDPEADNLLIAFWTDYQGNILDSAARPLSTFQDDPNPQFETDLADLTWDFGSAKQGTLLKRRFELASVGFQDLLTYLGSALGIGVEGPVSAPLSPADVGVYTMTINTAELAVGAFSRTLPIRTSDPQNPSQTVTIQGTIEPFTPDGTQSITVRPLDWPLTVIGPAGAGSTVTFEHTLGPNPQRLHPVKVYDQNYQVFYGVGKYAADFNPGTAPGSFFGTGTDNDLVVVAGSTQYTDQTRTTLSASVSPGQTQITVGTSTGILIGDEILIIQMTGIDGAGHYEFIRVAGISGNVLNLYAPIQRDYYVSSTSKTQVIRVPQYHNLTVQSGGILTAHDWNGSTGGVVAFRVQGTATINGQVSANGLGFRGGNGGTGQANSGVTQGWQGESPLGLGIQSRSANGGGGGGGQGDDGSREYGAGGGGGGHTGSGGTGQNAAASLGGLGGTAYGVADLSNIHPGAGGGGGGANDSSGRNGGAGGDGGGIILIASNTLVVNGTITANGSAGLNCNTGNCSGTGGGGGGSAGSIALIGRSINVGTSKVLALAGAAASGTSPGGAGGGGSIGRVHIKNCEPITGSTSPSAISSPIECHIMEQIEVSPYNSATLDLPENVIDEKVYQIQFGRRVIFDSARESTILVNLPKQLYTDATLDILISDTGVPSGNLTLQLDIGNDGIYDWNHNAITSFPAAFEDVTGFVAELNDYLISQITLDWGANIEVPIRINIDRPAQVILTNLQLQLQFNQPEALEDVDISADKPLDVPVIVPSGLSQGDWFTYMHSLEPDAVNLHPVKVYDQGYNEPPLGIGEHAMDFGGGTTPSAMFGDGSDGPWVISSNITSYSPPDASCFGSAGTSTLYASNVSFQNNQKILIHQSRGANAGAWEVNEITAYSAGVITLRVPLAHTYTDGGNDQAQVLVLREYTDVTVNPGIYLQAKAWNGDTGGILAFLANGTVTINGTVKADGNTVSAPGSGTSGFPPGGVGGGFRGGQADAANNDGSGLAYQGEGHPASSTWSTSPDGNGGGGGGYSHPYGVGVGGGGGNGTDGISGGGCGSTSFCGSGGNAYSPANPTFMVFGGGGGGGSKEPTYTSGGGGSGGGFIYLAGTDLTVSDTTGLVSANGGNGASADGPGGAGAGGSIYLKVRTATLNSARVRALGGSGGSGQAPGGAGGVGRIRVEYCELPTGSTNPTYNPSQLTCHIAEQIEIPPYDQGRLNLPADTGSGVTYQIQYGLRYVFGSPGEQIHSLQLNRQVYAAASLDALVSNAPVSSGNLNLQLDFGNDGSFDWVHNATTTFPAALTAAGWVDGLNNYLLDQTGTPWGSPIDVPVRVSIDRQADVMLTNLALTQVGVKTRYVRLPADSYSDVRLDLLFGQTGDPSSPLAFTVDVGADGSVDWSYSGSHTFPVKLTSTNLETAFDVYLAGLTGEVDVPIRIVPSPFVYTALTGFSATPQTRPDLTLTSGDIVFSSPSPVEGDDVIVTANLHNPGSHASDGLTAAFYATAPGAGEWYIGSDFVSGIPAGGNAQAEILWNTLGYTGTVPVRVELDAYNRVLESNDSNNQASASLTIFTRADLAIPGFSLSDLEPAVGENITVTLEVRNYGQTAAGTPGVELYDGDPGQGGVLVGQASPSLGGGDLAFVEIVWQPASPGLHRLYTQVDDAGSVNEYNEGNNLSWLEVYVGFAGQVLVDSGTPAETAYDPGTGFGFIDVGQPDAVAICDAGVQPEDTLRRDPDGNVIYRFDHLLPGHFYHLDLTLKECDGSGRQESIYIDDNLITGTIDLTDAETHRLSLRLDPALYADHSIQVNVRAPGIDGAVVSRIDLYDIDYRYADSGGPLSGDSQYPGSRQFGWLDTTSVASTAWGSLPWQSVRVDQSDNSLFYRFDGLYASKRYAVHLTFYQSAGLARQLHADVDGLPSGVEVNTGDYVVHRETIQLPLDTYTTDGTVTVAVVRANGSGAFINEIALEEITLPVEAPAGPHFADCADNTGNNATVVVLSAVTIIGGVALEPGDGIAVYNSGNNLCAGVQSWTGDNIAITVWGDDSITPEVDGIQAGDDMLYRIWDASEGVEYSNVTASYTQGDGIYTANSYHVVSTLNLNTLQTQDQSLAGGWNTISSYIVPSDPAMPDVLSHIFSDVMLVKNGRGQVYWPAFNINQIGDWNVKDGYQVYMTAASSLTITGTQVAPEASPIGLSSGWAMVSYLRNTPMPIQTALNSVSGSLMLAKDGAGKVYWPQFNINQIGNMLSGQGYWLYLTSAGTLVYPANDILAGEQEALQVPALLEHFNCTERTGANATVMIPNQDPELGLPAGVKVEDGDELAVFGNRSEFCVGGLVWDAELKAQVFTIWGDDEVSDVVNGLQPGETMTWKLWRRASNEELGLSVTYHQSAPFQDDGAYSDGGLYLLEAAPQFQLYLPVLGR